MATETIEKGNSIIALPLDFVVVDIETTGLDYEGCDIIEVSAIRYENGNPKDSYTTLVKPPLEQIFFPFRGENGEYVERYIPDFIAELTGITDDMVKDAPTIKEVLPGFLEFVKDSLLMGHNIPFDIGFLVENVRRCGLPAFRNDYINTLRIVRKVFPDQPHYRLQDMADMCGITPSAAHRALADCETTASCYLHMRSKILAQMTEEEFKKLFVKKRPLNYAQFMENMDFSQIEADESSPIYGKTVVFTGTLERMPRKQALALVAQMGGIPAESLTKETNFLVIGNGEFVKSVKEGKTKKMQKAEAMALKGIDIHVVSENAFFKLLNG